LTLGILALVALSHLENDSLESLCDSFGDAQLGGGVPDPPRDGLTPLKVGYRIDRDSSVKMQCPLFPMSLAQGVGPIDLGFGQAEGVLKNSSKKALTPHPYLSVDTRHPAGSLVGGVHKGVIESDPIIKWVGPIQPLEFDERVALVRAVSQFGSIFGAHAYRLGEVLKIRPVFLELDHGTSGFHIIAVFQVITRGSSDVPA
jgi:hypothetical protein